MPAMDAELSQPRTSRRWMWIVVGSFALAAVCWFVARSESAPAKQAGQGPAPVPVAVMTVQQRDVAGSLRRATAGAADR